MFSFTLRKISKDKIDNLNELNPNIIVFIMYGVFFQIVLDMYKPFAVLFIKKIGGTDFHIALFFALPGLLACLFLLPGAYLISKFSYKKNLTTFLYFLSRLIILLLAFVPFLPEYIRPLTFVILIGIMNMPDSLAQTILQETVGNEFRGRVRSKAISLKNKFASVALIVVTLVTSLILSYLPKTDEQRIIYYQIFFSLAFIVSIFEIYMFKKFKDNSSSSPKPKINIKAILVIFKNKKFILYALTTSFSIFSWMCGWPLLAIFQINFLDANEFWLALFVISTALGSFISSGFWNRIILKYGNNTALVLSTFSISIAFFMYTFVRSLYLVPLISFINGIALIGLSTTILNGILIYTPTENRVFYLATFNTVYNICLFTSPFFGYFLKFRYDLLPAMIIVCILRLSSCFIIFLLTKLYNYKDA